jgi:hypothetical protein
MHGKDAAQVWGGVAHAARRGLGDSDEARALIDRILADLLRDLFGPLPFRPVAVDPAWLAWNGGTIPALARAVYDEHAFDRLPVLADALEEAGSASPDLLDHLRGPGPHVRGCWAVDLILGKS